MNAESIGEDSVHILAIGEQLGLFPVRRTSDAAAKP
jgi:hypothetical protein